MDCCPRKAVGGVEYQLVGVAGGGAEMPPDCRDGCVYTPVAMRYCFRPGSLPATCLAPGLENITAPVCPPPLTCPPTQINDETCNSTKGT